MAYDLGVAERLRDSLTDRTSFTEKNMFGGVAFMVRGSMCIGVVKEEICARVGKEAFDDALSQPGARPMDFTGRPMKGWLFVATDGFESDADLNGWVDRCLAFNQTLAAK